MMIAAISALFYVWLATLRAKTERPDWVSDQQLSPLSDSGIVCTDATASKRSLCPDQQLIPIASAMEPAGAQCASNVEAALTEPQQSCDSPCPIAATHLEVAHQIYLMGDLDGAMELATLVTQSTVASKRQVSEAYKLKRQCC